jgi:hypothetical protein
MIKPAQAAPMGKKYRISSDSASVWPLRGADGKTFAQRRISCAHNYAYTSGIGMGHVLYRCTLCGDTYEKDVS